MARRTKKRTTRRAKRKRTTRPRRAGSGRYRAKIRMYRHGLGDCFLIRLPRKGRSDYTIMIDCGVILGTPDPATVMTEVIRDIAAETGGRIDLLVATHEHWDHLSGFIQAQEEFDKLDIGEVWFAWTEDPADTLAQKYRREHARAFAALQLGMARMQLAGDADGADQVGGLLEFFGAARGRSTKDALAHVKSKVAKKRYCLPQDKPVEIPGTGVHIYVLGPPHDEKKLKKINPSKRHRETYGLALDGLDLFLEDVESAFADNPMERPFTSLYEIPLPLAAEMDFFKNNYWRPGNSDEDWRRIDTSWLDRASELALQLDSLTNNTSLVLAIELADNDVLLFAADAQVGNWLSWEELSWTVDGRKVTGPDLLARTIYYKVGHHGSHNATLKEKGLELMAKLRVAMIPVDQKMARKKRWNHMPFNELVKALKEKADGGLFIADRAPPDTRERLVDDKLYFEITF